MCGFVANLTNKTDKNCRRLSQGQTPDLEGKHTVNYYAIYRTLRERIQMCHVFCRQHDRTHVLLPRHPARHHVQQPCRHAECHWLLYFCYYIIIVYAKRSPSPQMQTPIKPLVAACRQPEKYRLRRYGRRGCEPHGSGRAPQLAHITRHPGTPDYSHLMLSA